MKQPACLSIKTISTFTLQAGVLKTMEKRLTDLVLWHVKRSTEELKKDEAEKATSSCGPVVMEVQGKLFSGFSGVLSVKLFHSDVYLL